MPVNSDRVDKKINSIDDKDVSAITNEQVSIPFLDEPYTETDLNNWLDIRTNFLNEIKTKTDKQIEKTTGEIYRTLSRNGKDIADMILDDIPGEQPVPDNLDDFEGLAKIRLIKLATS